jgi:hypothetical protein
MNSQAGCTSPGDPQTPSTALATPAAPGQTLPRQYLHWKNRLQGSSREIELRQPQGLPAGNLVEMSAQPGDWTPDQPCFSRPSSSGRSNFHRLGPSIGHFILIFSMLFGFHWMTSFGMFRVGVKNTFRAALSYLTFSARKVASHFKQDVNYRSWGKYLNLTRIKEINNPGH